MTADVNASISCELTYWSIFLSNVKNETSYKLYNMSENAQSIGENRYLRQLFMPTGAAIKSIANSPSLPMYKCIVRFYGSKPIFDVKIVMKTEVRAIQSESEAKQDRPQGPFSNFHMSVAMSGDIFGNPSFDVSIGNINPALGEEYEFYFYIFDMNRFVTLKVPDEFTFTTLESQELHYARLKGPAQNLIPISSRRDQRQ